MGWHRIAWNGAVWCCMEWHWIALHRLYLYGVAFYVMVWHSVAWFGCIDRTYTLLLSITFWGASSKSDYLVLLSLLQTLSPEQKRRQALSIAISAKRQNIFKTQKIKRQFMYSGSSAEGCHKSNFVFLKMISLLSKIPIYEGLFMHRSVFKAKLDNA